MQGGRQEGLHGTGGKDRTRRIRTAAARHVTIVRHTYKYIMYAREGRNGTNADTARKLCKYGPKAMRIRPKNFANTA